MWDYIEEEKEQMQLATHLVYEVSDLRFDKKKFSHIALIWIVLTLVMCYVHLIELFCKLLYLSVWLYRLMTILRPLSLSEIYLHPYFSFYSKEKPFFSYVLMLDNIILIMNHERINLRDFHASKVQFWIYFVKLK